MRPRYTPTERPRCEAMTTMTRYEEAHRCPYQVEDESAAAAPRLCSKHLALAARRVIELHDGRRYSVETGIIT